MTSIATSNIGVVAIGRNEGDRLRVCLASVIGEAAATVYVDSGSADGSADMARGLGAVVVDLDMRQPFTAARARNALTNRRQDARFILGSTGPDVPYETPPENLLAIRRTVEESGPLDPTGITMP